MTDHPPRWLRDRTFAATCPAGRTVFVHVEAEANASPGTGRESFGPRPGARLVTSTGGPVVRVGEGVYVVRSTGAVLRSADPDAP